MLHTLHTFDNPGFHFTDDYCDQGHAFTRPLEWLEAMLRLDYDFTDGNAQLEYGE